MLFKDLPLAFPAVAAQHQRSTICDHPIKMGRRRFVHLQHTLNGEKRSSIGRPTFPVLLTLLS